MENLIALWINDNQFSGSLPEGTENMPSLETILVYNNEFSGLPDFTNLNPRDLFVYNNKLEFDDIAQNISVFDNSFDYLPQKKINEVQFINPAENESISLIADTYNDGNNSYEWFKDGFPIDGANEDLLSINFDPSADIGTYFCQVTNPAVPDLILVRNNIYVGLETEFVLEKDSLALIALYEATNGNNWFSSELWDLNEPISFFEGVSIENSRVTSLDLVNVGFLNYATLPEKLLDLDSLSTLDIRANNVRSIPDFSQLKTIDVLNVSQNNIPVWDLAKIISLEDDGVEVIYGSQSNRVVNTDVEFEENEDVEIVAEFHDTSLEDDGSNVYQWYKDETALENETESILSFTYTSSDAGIYYCTVTHPSVQDVVTESNRVRVNIVPTQIILSNTNIQENLSIATEVGELTTIDPEANDIHTYELLNSPAFFLDGNIVRSNQVFDRNEQSSHFLTVRSTDKNDISITETFIIRILEEIEIIPEPLEDFPASGRSGAVSLVLDGNVYIGLGQENTTLYQDFWKYNTETSSWEQVTDFPGDARANAVAFEVNGKGYIGLGNGESFSTLYQDFYELDPSNDTWAQVADFGGTARYKAVSFSAEGHGFVGTGRDINDETKDFWQYNPETDQWSQVADLNASQRSAATAFSIDGKGYVTGGFFIDDDFFTEQFSDIQEYNPATNTWTERVFADGLKLAFQDASATVGQNQAFIFYGNQEMVTSYDPLTNDLNDLGDTLKLGFDRRGGVSFTLGNEVFFGLGSYTEDIFGDPIYPTSFKSISLPVEVPNEAPSEIILDNAEVEENINGGTVGRLYSIDSNVEDQHTYTLVDGEGSTDNSTFVIEGDLLKFPGAFNFEEQSSYQIRIQTEDQDGAQFQKAFTITIVNINDAPTDIELSNDEILEKESEDTLVGLFTTSDDDEGDDHTYRLITGTDDFYIDENQLFSKVSFDFTVRNSYSIRVETQDLDGETFQETFEIKVLDTNVAPSDISLSGNSINENEAVGFIIGELSTTDENEDDTHTYELVSSGSEFRIVGSQLVSNAILDFEEQTSYAIRIASEDQDGATFEKDFTIEIVDLEDPLGLEEGEINGLSIYPNPVLENLAFEINDGYLGTFNALILDASGKVILEKQLLKLQPTQNFEIDTKEIPQGVYFLSIKELSRTLRVLKINE